MCVEAYAAGLFDGEGCVTVNRVSDTLHQLRVKFGMADRGPLELLAKHFGGGNITEYAPPKGRLIYLWSLSGHQAQEFLLAIMPHVVCKADQVALALEYPWEAGAPSVVSMQTYQMRGEIRDRLQELKRHNT